MRLKGKVAVVTGSGGRGKQGIGRAVALRLAREGVNVAVVDLCRERPNLPASSGFAQWEDLMAVADEIRALGVRCIPIKADVTDEGEVKAMADAVWAEFGRIDILCGAVGGGIGGSREFVPVLELERSGWDYTLALSLTSQFLVCKYVGKRIVEGGRGGRIIFISSIGAKMSVVGAAPYTSAKNGLLTLTRSLAMELAPHQITVNAICPGAVHTMLMEEFVDSLLQKDADLDHAKAIRHIEGFTPLGRIGTGEDIANAVAFFASDEADWITGQDLNVDGGACMY